MTKQTRNTSTTDDAHGVTSSIEHAFIGKLLIYISLISLGIAFVLSGKFLLLLLGQLLIGAMFAHGVELQHQCLHNTGFKQKKLNVFFGRALGIPMLVSFHHYQTKHLWHHAHLGTQKDQEFFSNTEDSMESQRFADRLRFVLSNIFKWNRLLAFGQAAKSAISGKKIELIAKKYAEERIRQDYILILFCLVAVISLSLLFSWKIFVLCWLLPFFLVAIPLHSLIEFPEHYRCQRSDRSPFKNTRTIDGSAFSFWYTNGNNLHVEHHLCPSLPIDLLPALMKKQLGMHHFRQNSYGDFLKMVAADLRWGVLRQSVNLKSPEVKNDFT